MAEDGVLKKCASLRVNIGCGSRFVKDWTNLDFVSHSPSVIAHDLSKGIPLSDNSYDFVYSSHVLEHFSAATGEQILRECFRILKPFGRIRIVVPDTEFLAQNYLDHLVNEKRTAPAANLFSLDYEWSKLALFDQFMRNSSGGEMVHILASRDEEALKSVFELEGSEFRYIHKALTRSKCVGTKDQTLSIRKIAGSVRNRGRRWLLQKLIGPRWEQELAIGRFRLGGEVHYAAYDEVSLRKALINAGFNAISRYTANTSGDHEWKNFKLDIEDDGRPYKSYSLYMEGTKV